MANHHCRPQPAALRLLAHPSRVVSAEIVERWAGKVNRLIDSFRRVMKRPIQMLASLMLAVSTNAHASLTFVEAQVIPNCHGNDVLLVDAVATAIQMRSSRMDLPISLCRRSSGSTMVRDTFEIRVRTSAAQNHGALVAAARTGVARPICSSPTVTGIMAMLATFGSTMVKDGLTALPSFLILQIPVAPCWVI